MGKESMRELHMGHSLILRVQPHSSKGFATGFGGPPACWLVAEHFERFLTGKGEFLLHNVSNGRL